MVRGKLPPRKIAPSPNFNANPKPNPDPDRGAIFLGSNFPDNQLYTTANGYHNVFPIANTLEMLLCLLYAIVNYLANDLELKCASNKIKNFLHLSN